MVVTHQTDTHSKSEDRIAYTRQLQAGPCVVTSKMLEIYAYSSDVEHCDRRQQMMEGFPFDFIAPIYCILFKPQISEMAQWHIRRGTPSTSFGTR